MNDVSSDFENIMPKIAALTVRAVVVNDILQLSKHDFIQLPMKIIENIQQALMICNVIICTIIILTKTCHYEYAFNRFAFLIKINWK